MKNTPATQPSKVSTNPNHPKTTPAKASSRTSVEETLSALDNGIKAGTVLQSQFVTSVVSITEGRSHAKVKLCTGRMFDVPISLLKNVADLGSVEDDAGRRAIAVGEFDISTEAGVLLQQMAHEMTRLSHSLSIARNRLRRRHDINLDTSKTLAMAEDVPAAASKITVTPFDTVLPGVSIKVVFKAVSGTPHYITYNAPDFQYIQTASIRIDNLVSCYISYPPSVNAYITGHRDQTLGFSFGLEAEHGTPLGVTYEGWVYINVVLVQLTT